jgi:hypothetical protein
VGAAALGGARMEVRWHRSPGAPELGQLTEHLYPAAGSDPAQELLLPLDSQQSPHAR